MVTRVPYEDLRAIIERALLAAGLTTGQAAECAKIHADSSLDGVESHGLNRVPRFVDYVRRGWVDPTAKLELVGAKGAVENYDGHLGIGVLNAERCMDRAIELAKAHGIGCVALRNTTHWMRGGTYAWQAARAGYIGISWTNTESCMPMWGSKESGVGNNPLCIAIPRERGAIVLDMAMSQYSYGKLGVYRLAGESLPYAGGFDEDGNLTDDPGAIERSMRILPAGYWKGSGLAMVLDLAAASMANGRGGSDINADETGSCGGCCQVFIAYDPYLFGDREEIQAMYDRRVAAADATAPDREGGAVTCPGERMAARRALNLKEGVPVDDRVWKQVQDIAAGVEGDIVDLSKVDR